MGCGTDTKAASGAIFTGAASTFTALGNAGRIPDFTGTAGRAMGKIIRSSARTSGLECGIIAAPRTGTAAAGSNAGAAYFVAANIALTGIGDNRL